ncbi:MAG: hypothetical protein WC389_21955 [Lutibacter sp.]|jgi:hypothetical protein
MKDTEESRKLPERHTISIRDVLKGLDPYSVTKKEVTERSIIPIPDEQNYRKSKRNYIELLKDPRWQRKRLEILNRDNFTCIICNDSKSNLQVHHKYYIKSLDPWEYDSFAYLTLCEDCHKDIEIKKEMLNRFLYGKFCTPDHLYQLTEIIKLINSDQLLLLKEAIYSLKYNDGLKF